MTWSWKTDPVGYRELCCGCTKPLRSQPGPYVQYVGHYHVGCLLDQLCGPGQKAPPSKDEPEQFLMWGGAP